MWFWFWEKLSNMDNNIFGYYLFSPFSLHSILSIKYTEQVPGSILRGILAYQNIDIGYIYSGIFFFFQRPTFWSEHRQFMEQGKGMVGLSTLTAYCLSSEHSKWTGHHSRSVANSAMA